MERTDSGVLQHAGDAAFNFCAFERHLPQPDVVQRLDSFAPGVDLGLINVTCCDRVFEKQRQ